VKNAIASIQYQLKQLAVAEGKAYQLVLTRYFQERLLFRLAASAYSNQFCLKGGTLLYAVEQQKSRPTLDIDLLAMGLSRETDRLPQIFSEIGGIDYEMDGVVFDTATLTAEPITKAGPYPGVRLKLPVSLGNIRQPLQIDVGFGDIVTPAPVRMSYPTLLAMEQPQILAYSLETVIAGKFDAMIDLAEINSRMKDFYDVYRLLA
jgi:predicted nucleotidyltransferase component of viral defense system